VSGTAFLRRHGWKSGAGYWHHERLPSAAHVFESALLQQAQWQEQELEALKRERSAHTEEPEA
jgi:membrane-bound lytic murein transglycosylase B